MIVISSGREDDRPGADYIFNLLEKERLVAQLKHNFRGEYAMIRTPGGTWEPFNLEIGSWADLKAGAPSAQTEELVRTFLAQHPIV